MKKRLYVEIPTHPHRHAQILMPAFKNPFLGDSLIEAP
jgi:hypothetical protein